DTDPTDDHEQAYGAPRDPRHPWRDAIDGAQEVRVTPLCCCVMQWHRVERNRGLTKPVLLIEVIPIQVIGDRRVSLAIRGKLERVLE
ncbi:MAG: hypothetical protein Q7V14_00610, partial [Coriobacteriia bacterium]|nr:hypothetical protein [Coriobacteriia bacterium]